MSAALLGLLLVFNAVSAALNPALVPVNEAGVSKLTAHAPIAAQFREPAAVAKASANRTTVRHDDGVGGDPALPAAAWSIGTPIPGEATTAPVSDASSPRATPGAYRARAPPFAA